MKPTKRMIESKYDIFEASVSRRLVRLAFGPNHARYEWPAKAAGQAMAIIDSMNTAYCPTLDHNVRG